MSRGWIDRDAKVYYMSVDIRDKSEELLKVDYIASMIILMVIWAAGCEIVDYFDGFHDAYKMLIGYVFGTFGVFASGMNKH